MLSSRMHNIMNKWALSQTFLLPFASTTGSSSSFNRLFSLKYSQTWEIRPPKGLGVSDPIFQVVSFARFGSKIFKMELYTCPCASHDISDRWFPRVSGGVIGNDNAKRSLKNAKIARSECLRRKVRQSKMCFSLQFDACGRFLQVESTLWADFRCPQFAFLRWSHFQERTPYI